MRQCIGVLLACVLSWSTPACTIFVLTDASRTLFFNNEDWSNPKTRVWFVPAGKGYYGCAYVGFDDGWAQGGLNTEGLAFDWVAGFNDPWKAERGMKRVRGNSSQRMLESCSTVDDAIAFYRTHREPSFARSRILVADRTGASAIIGYKDGKLSVDPSGQCRGFGYGRKIVEEALANPPAPTVENGMNILRASAQKGAYPTRYSNAFDLRNGDLFLVLPDQEGDIQLNLAAEIARGPHYYDLPEIREQLSQPPRPLLNEMERFFLDKHEQIPDLEPQVTKKVRGILRQASQGSARSEDYTPELWNEISPRQAQMQADLNKLGRLVSLTLVNREEKDGQRVYRYRLNFKNAAVLQFFAFDQKNKLAASRSEGVEWKR